MAPIPLDFSESFWRIQGRLSREDLPQISEEEHQRRPVMAALARP